jgi:hypothetical protein
VGGLTGGSQRSCVVLYDVGQLRCYMNLDCVETNFTVLGAEAAKVGGIALAGEVGRRLATAGGGLGDGRG